MVKEVPSIANLAHSQWLRYGFALAAVALSVTLTLFLRPVIEPSVFPFFIAAVMITAWYGGLGPSLLATILAVLAIETLFIQNPGPLRYLHGYIRLVLFVLVSLLISSLTAARKRAEEALLKAHGELEQRVRERTVELATVNESLRVEIKKRERTEQQNQKLLYDLGERVKELTALHRAAHLVQDEKKTRAAILQEIVDMLPDAGRYPDITAARIVFDGAEFQTSNFRPPFHQQLRTEFATLGGRRGSIEIVSLAVRPEELDEPFSPEEKRLAESLAEMLESYFQRREAADRVAQVSRELIESNRELWRLQSEFNRVEPLAALGRVTSTIAHELGTPLNSVLGYTQLMAQDELTENGRRRMEIIKTQVERMISIINHYLTSVRSSFQQRHRINVNGLVEETLVMLKPIFQQHRINLETELASSLPSIIADAPSLQRVLVNLLDNSIDAIKDGGTLKIKTDTCPSLGNEPPRIVITVTDSGEGIPPEMLNKIFEMFVTTKAPGRGSGLGLAICQEIVKEHGGTIEITSDVGKGTCARVYLPVENGSGDAV
jgi:signal transduction histidine kinase